MNEEGELLRQEWFKKTSWQNRAYLRKLDGCITKEVNMVWLRDYLNQLVSPQLAIAGHLDDKAAIDEVCTQILKFLRFLPEKERNHKVELMMAAFGFDYDITGSFKERAETFARYQKKLDFRRKWLWFLPSKKYVLPL